MEANLEERLKELEEAKQRQVRQILSMGNFLNHEQIVRKTELRKEEELVAAEVKEKNGYSQNIILITFFR